VTPSTLAGRAGELTVLAGFPTISSDFPFRQDGYATVARFREATYLAIDSAASPGGSGTVYVSDYPTIRQINGGQSIVTSPPPAATVGSAAPVDGPLSTATIRSATALADDNGGPRIRRLTTTGASAGVVTLPAGTAQGISRINGMAFDATRNVLYVADSLRHVIWRVTLSPTVTVSVFAGSPDLFGSVDGTGTAARFFYPNDVAVDAVGNVFVADTSNHVIRRITPAGVVTLYAGAVGEIGYLDAAAPGNARFYFPSALAVDSEGSVYVAEPDNQAVRRISPTRAVTTVVGNGSFNGLQLGPLPGSVFRPTDVAVIPGSQTLVILGFGAVDPNNSFRGFGGMVFVARPATRWP
jgi:sugar lactone lactonase YvrE